jgi:hypothetical protein
MMLAAMDRVPSPASTADSIMLMGGVCPAVGRAGACIT